jgi:uncharacterized protein HemY
MLLSVHDLQATDLHHLNAASGWLGLGCPKDAREELGKLSATKQSHPAVLDMRWLIASHEKNWTEALSIAELELKVAPDTASGWLHRAYSLRRVNDDGLIVAWHALLPAAEKFPSEPVIAYNLSCYACQMNEMVTARTWLHQAIKVGKKEEIKKMALADDDLKPLWSEIQEL